MVLIYNDCGEQLSRRLWLFITIVRNSYLGDCRRLIVRNSYLGDTVTIVGLSRRLWIYNDCEEQLSRRLWY